MALRTDNDTDLTIGVSLDTTQLPLQSAEAERRVKQAVAGATAAVEAQGAAATRMGKAHQQAADAAQRGMQQVGATGQASAESIARGMNISTLAAQAFGGALERVNLVMGVLSKGFGILGMANQVIELGKKIHSWWKDAGKQAEDAGAAFRRAWKAQETASRKLAAQRAPIEALERQLQLHELILAKMRETAAFEAEMRGLAARREGHEEAASQAGLDGLLARDAISEAQHIRLSRVSEDRLRSRAQENELAGLRETLAQAERDEEHALRERAAAIVAREELLRRGRQAGLVDDAGADTDKIFQAAQRMRGVTEFRPATAKAGSAGVDAFLEQTNRQQAEAQRIILRAAEVMDVSTSDNNNKRLTLDEIAQQVMNRWKDARAAMEDKVVQTAAALPSKAAATLNARQRIAATQEVHAAANEEVEERRRQQDATLDQQAGAAAQHAYWAAREAQEEQAAAAARRKAEARVAKRRKQQAAAEKAVAEKLRHLEEGASPKQQGAAAALRRVMTRAEEEPEAMDYLERVLAGARVNPRHADMRRYGADLVAVKGGGWDAAQLRELRELLRLFRTASAAANRTARAEKGVDKLDRAQQQQQEHERDLRVRDTQQEAQRTAEEAQQMHRLRFGAAEVPGLSHLGDAGQQLRAAAGTLSGTADAAARDLAAIAQASAQMAATTTRQAAETQRALAEIRAAEAQMRRLEQQKNYSMT